MPTVTRADPYIHLLRDEAGRIVRILHRREGDAMPESGESDMGVFALPYRSFNRLLPQYAAHVSPGSATGERNFLPFIAWANREHDVVTFPAVDAMEANALIPKGQVAGVRSIQEWHARSGDRASLD